ncbi:UspA domain protein [Natronomonas pharaonis DSM 2160]|uniref:UspA domain protein n=1 Tax=Natronomonas pharaonis (strain ATCC 35678 / DSM 2160 / CIP 103997 / JCM 8858 / NBRC 14720 / NCIMB 2260 / Gabara) TaxID=348780 RepID=A0A1U7EVN6_NATPD|nr:universal stress protein [Natronomonas pharaonis]CAI49108.1 UspA domain protein [Natronomonas pharaonis DSM 2160]
MYDTILVPTDGGGGIGRVIDHAAEIAAAHGAALQFLYVLNTDSAAVSAAAVGGEAHELLRSQGEEALADADARVDVPTETALLEGQPADRIVEYADRTGCDLIVMGTHGRGGLGRLLLGSVAERVVRLSSQPVLTVHVDDSADNDKTSLEEVSPVTVDPAVSGVLE